MIEDIKNENRPGPGPAYIPDDKVVKPSRYDNILLGGHAPRDWFSPDKNPGPGEYTIPDIATKSHRMAKSYRTSHVVRQNSLMMTQSETFVGSPRECAFNIAAQGDPFHPAGYIRGPQT